MATMQDQPMDRRVYSGEVGLHLADWRSADAQQTLLCLHGITANARAFDGIARAMAPEIGVVALDFRGRGESDKPDGPYGGPTHADDVIAVLDALALDRVAVAGWSLGSLVSLLLAANYPERVERLVLIDPPLAALSEQCRASLGRVQERLGRTYPDEASAMAAMRASGALGDWNAALEAYVRADLEELADGQFGHRMPKAVLAKEWEAGIPPLTAVIPKITCPVLILRATDTLFQENDEVLTERAVEKALQVFADARAVDIPGTNHYTIALGQPAATIAAIRDFLTGDQE